MFTRSEIRELNKFDNIYCLVSGGKDSTFTALNLHNLRKWIKRPVILLHNNTGLRMRKAKKIIRVLDHQLCEKNGWFFEQIDAKDYLEKPMMFYVRESIKMIDKALKKKSEGKYSKNMFPCCYWLKERPFEQWLKQQDHKNDVFVLSIKQGDSRQRGLFLSKLRKLKTYYWFNRRRKVTYYYPLRDCKQETVNSYLLQDKLFWDTDHTGCVKCPVVMMFDLEDSKSN
jgi:3'-phosphoadenosine 5'-phosphosulfate sulfotransferase (PAPS reductase)/FAD synthetase